MGCSARALVAHALILVLDVAPARVDSNTERLIKRAPARLLEVEADARAAGLATRRTGTSVAVLRVNGNAPDGERRPANLEDVFVLLTGEEIA